MLFWKRKLREAEKSVDLLDPAEIVSTVSTIYVDYNEKGQVVKPRSSLPCSWFDAREFFMIAYEREYLELPKNFQDSYHLMYCELAFFVDDRLCETFEKSFNIAVKCLSDSGFKLPSGIPDEKFFRYSIAGSSMLVHSNEDRDEIWTRLSQQVPTCPAHDRLRLAQTLAYCSAMHKVMWDEWAAFANLIAYQKKTADGLGKK